MITELLPLLSCLDLPTSYSTQKSKLRNNWNQKQIAYKKRIQIRRAKKKFAKKHK